MTILVGIPTHKRPELLKKCLDSIARQEGDLPQVHVFIADNDATGTEGTAVVVELAPSFRFPLSSKVVEAAGISAARNAILAEAKSRRSNFIAMIDDDETASSNWLVELLKSHADYEADVVAGPVLFDIEGDRSFEGALWSDPRPSGRTDIVFATNNVLVSAAALQRMDWPRFDAQFGLTGGGDREWFVRLKKFGASFAWASAATVSEVVPPERRKLGWFLKRQFRVGENQIRIAIMHRDALEICILLAKAVGVILLSPLLALRSTQPSHRNKLLRKLARVAGLIGGLLGIRHEEYAERHREIINRP